MLINKIGEGAFSEVLKSQSLKTGNTVAIKCMKNQFQSIVLLPYISLGVSATSSRNLSSEEAITSPSYSEAY